MRGKTDNAFLNAILYAYNNHLTLRISPDDILQCVSMAVGACINDNAEKLREVFVDHSGKKKLTIIAECPPGKFDWTMLLSLMSSKIDENVKSDLGLESTFTTSSTLTKNVASLMKMASFKKYFSYGMMLCCGIRSVDLTGTLDDWVHLQTKINHVQKLFASQGLMANWFKHLDVIVSRLVDTFRVGDGVVSEELANFWSRIVTFVPYGSGGQRYVSGWAKVLFPGSLYDEFPEKLHILDPASVPPECGDDYYGWQNQMKTWAQLCEDAPNGTTNVSAELNDHGYVYDLHCVTGHVGWCLDDHVVVPRLGYYVHAVCKDKPEVTDDAEASVIADRRSEFTGLVVKSRGTKDYAPAQVANLSDIATDQVRMVVD